MDKIQFENLASTITGLKIKLYEPENDSKYALYYNNFDILKPSKKYGVQIDGCILYDFKTTSKTETFIKSFINQHINKYECKQIKSYDKGFVYYKKDDIIKKYRDQNRVNKFFYYTTLYGIGMFSFFTKDVKTANIKLTEYLQKNNISFYNEFSDAGWAYRFVIKQDVNTHNNLLDNFNF